MRPIDADALKEQAYESREWSHGGHPFVVEVDDIDDAPTIDPDDLRPKGEWVIKVPNGLQRCPECGSVRPFVSTEDDGVEYWSGSYCIVCGAKMGGGE